MSLFFRLNTDSTCVDVNLENQYAGPSATACWLIGGGPALNMLSLEEIRDSPLPKMTVNLAGCKLLRPTFWTSYDPTMRFHRSIYLDPGVTKFVHRRRAMDIVPETTFKVADCPNVYFFERMKERGYSDFLSTAHAGIVDWADSLVQAIDILFRLGFRKIYLAGCEMRVRPSRAQIELARSVGVAYHPRQLLTSFLKDCEQQGLTASQLDELAPGLLYHFDEQKTIRNAARTEQHYFRILQYLRLSRRNMSLAGLQLISVTPHSRLNDHFPYLPASKVLRHIARTVGNPATESTRGLYTQIERTQQRPLGPMRDYRPHHWQPDQIPAEQLKPNGPAQHPDAGILIENEGFVPEVSPKQKHVARNGKQNCNGKGRIDRFANLNNVLPNLNEEG